MYDVLIIGAGVSGCAAARELSRFRINACVLEKEEDVCCGTSKANSGIVHAGFDARHGSLMASLNIRGNARMESLSQELDFPFRRNGSLVICREKKDLPKLQALYDSGIQNGVPGLKIMTGAEVCEMEPNIDEEIYAALYAPTGGIVCPFELNIALAENAYANGVEFRFNTEVLSLNRADSFWEVKTNQGTLQTRYVVNAAGVFADIFHNMVSAEKIHITPRKGEYCLLDKTAGGHVSRTIFALPDKYGKGVLVTPTVHGNLLLGPTADDIEDKEATCTTASGLSRVLEKARKNVKNIPVQQVITSFAGLRAHENGHDFLIGELPDAPGFIDCAGIESPGLTSCPAVGEMIAEILKERLALKPDPDFTPYRKGITHLSAMSFEERSRLIRENPAYGNIICRCESISEGEIMDAIHRPLGARSLDGIKRRTRAGMGRCQAGFCSPKVMEILARELETDLMHITKCGGNSFILNGINKDVWKKGRHAANENI